MTLRQRARRALGSLRPGTPRLSVVVPVHNLESYLPECLDSILGQSFRDLEVLVVDDGSTDRSADVARGYASRHPDVRVVSTANQGLGAARNVGVGHTRGELIAFADSDDTVLPGGYAAMVSVLDESGSDFVVGAFHRNFPDRTGPPPRQRALHRERRLAVTADDFPEILGDVFAWNKMFRRDFWERAQMAFPEGVRYEDQPALTRAYLTARSFDVIKRPVYLWRIRHDGSSITQGRQYVDDLRDRFATKRDSLETVRRLGSARVLRRFYLDGLVMDLPVYFRHIPGCDDAWWQMLHGELRDVWEGAPSFALTTLPPAHRLVAWLVVHDRRSEAESVVRFAEGYRPIDLPVQDRGDHMVVLLPFCDDPSSGIPAELYRLQEHERSARLQRAHAAADTGRSAQSDRQ